MGVTEQGMECGNNFMGLVTRATNLGSPTWICMTLPGMNIFPYVYLVKGNPISDQTDMGLYSCYSYALSVCHVLCSTVRFANIDRLKPS
jgi:hypothetical protein